MIDNTFELMA